MSGSTRSRQKRKLEPISIEELAGTTGMSGFCTFLTRDASVGVPALDALESTAHERAALDSSAVHTQAPAFLENEASALELSACETSAADTAALEASASVASPPELEFAAG